LVPRGARAMVLYTTGLSVTYTGNHAIERPRERPQGSIFRRILRTLDEVAQTDARVQPNRQGMVRPVAGAAVPIEPRNGIALRAERPTFVWYAVPGAAGYVLQLRHLASGRIERWETGRDTAWRLPPETSLARGAEYEWTVAAVGGGRAAPVQRFRVATPAQADSVQARLMELLRAGVDPAGEQGLFLVALAYRDAGLFYEARDALDRLAAAGGGNGRAFHLLRADVYDALGRLDLAAAALARADAAGGG
ncbi:MAG TPA: hypothetical protein VFX98_04120, partial [Longimicrobiaceae bacterium]|nr:hypothetical protein [Longimicrobiaceae bacterium]